MPRRAHDRARDPRHAQRRRSRLQPASARTHGGGAAGVCGERGAPGHQHGGGEPARRRARDVPGRRGPRPREPRLRGAARRRRSRDGLGDARAHPARDRRAARIDPAEDGLGQRLSRRRRGARRARHRRRGGDHRAGRRSLAVPRPDAPCAGLVVRRLCASRPGNGGRAPARMRGPGHRRLFRRSRPQGRGRACPARLSPAPT